MIFNIAVFDTFPLPSELPPSATNASTNGRGGNNQRQSFNPATPGTGNHHNYFILTELTLAFLFALLHQLHFLLAQQSDDEENCFHFDLFQTTVLEFLEDHFLHAIIDLELHV